MMKIFMPPVRRGLLACLLCLGLIQGLSAQDDNFTPFTDSLQMRYQDRNDEVWVWFDDPGDAAGMNVAFYNTRGSIVHWAMIPYEKSYCLQLGIESSPYYTDTLVVVIGREEYADFPSFPPEVIYLNGNYMSAVTFGTNCVEVDCIPFQDPYMPSTLSPTLIQRHAHYLNPKTGKILKGKRAIFKYDECELETLILIHPVLWYTNSKGESVRGSELIRKRRLDMRLWKDEME